MVGAWLDRPLERGRKHTCRWCWRSISLVSHCASCRLHSGSTYAHCDGSRVSKRWTEELRRRVYGGLVRVNVVVGVGPSRLTPFFASGHYRGPDWLATLSTFTSHTRSSSPGTASSALSPPSPHLGVKSHKNQNNTTKQYKSVK